MDKFIENYRIDGEDEEEIVERRKGVTNFEVFQGI